jgi:hypothetical protein
MQDFKAFLGHFFRTKSLYLHAAYDIGINSRCKVIWHDYAANKDTRWTGDPHLMLEWRQCHGKQGTVYDAAFAYCS